MVSLCFRDIDPGTVEGHTPLMMGAGRGHSSIVSILLDEGADVLIAGDGGSQVGHIVRGGSTSTSWPFLADAGMADAGRAFIAARDAIIKLLLLRHRGGSSEPRTV